MGTFAAFFLPTEVKSQLANSGGRDTAHKQAWEHTRFCELMLALPSCENTPKIYPLLEVVFHVTAEDAPALGSQCSGFEQPGLEHL